MLAKNILQNTEKYYSSILQRGNFFLEKKDKNPIYIYMKSIGIKNMGSIYISSYIIGK